VKRIINITRVVITGTIFVLLRERFGGLLAGAIAGVTVAVAEIIISKIIANSKQDELPQDEVPLN
jgi:hypothetical protein